MLERNDVAFYEQASGPTDNEPTTIRELIIPCRLRKQYSQMSVTGREKIYDREVYVVEAQPLGAQASLPAPTHRTEKLFFDTQSGLLLRRTVLTRQLWDSIQSTRTSRTTPMWTA